MNSFGIEPPKTLFSNAMLSSKSELLGLGACAGGERLDVDRAVAELAAAAGLLHVLAADVLGLAGDRLAVARPSACRRSRRP